MNLPKIKFKKVPLSWEIRMFKRSLLRERRYERFKKLLPGFCLIEKMKSEKERDEFIESYVGGFWQSRDNRDKVKEARVRYEAAWREIEQEFFVRLSEMIQMDWPRRRRTIKAFLSINPISPRCLKDWSFMLPWFFQDVRDAFELIMHECCHFLYFKKWQEIFPGSDKETFESPHLEWHLSEIVAPIVLNDLRISKLLDKKAVVHERYWQTKIDKQTVFEYFTVLYNQDVGQKNDFEGFLKRAYREIKKYRDLFTTSESPDMASGRL